MCAAELVARAASYRVEFGRVKLRLPTVGSAPIDAGELQGGNVGDRRKGAHGPSGRSSEPGRSLTHHHGQPWWERSKASSATQSHPSKVSHSPDLFCFARSRSRLFKSRETGGAFEIEDSNPRKPITGQVRGVREPGRMVRPAYPAALAWWRSSQRIGVGAA